jgi:hypothetical protein
LIRRTIAGILEGGGRLTLPRGHDGSLNAAVRGCPCRRHGADAGGCSAGWRTRWIRMAVWLTIGIALA